MLPLANPLRFGLAAALLALAACQHPEAEHPVETPPAARQAADGVAGVEPLALPAPRAGTVVGATPSDDGDAAVMLSEEPEPTAEPAAGGITVLPGGVGVEDIIVGNGPEVQPGMRLSVHYVGQLEDGTQFDSSRKRNQPFVYEFGAGRVIAGWEEGIAGMRVGGVRRLLIPPSKGYGSRKMASIPPDSILQFEIELLGIE